MEHVLNEIDQVVLVLSSQHGVCLRVLCGQAKSWSCHVSYFIDVAVEPWQTVIGYNWSSGVQHLVNNMGVHVDVYASCWVVWILPNSTFIYLHTKSYLTLVCEYRILMTIMQTATIKLAMEQHTSSLSPLHYEVIIPLITLLVVKKMVQKTSQFTGKDYIWRFWLYSCDCHHALTQNSWSYEPFIYQ